MKQLLENRMILIISIISVIGIACQNNKKPNSVYNESNGNTTLFFVEVNQLKNEYKYKKN